MGHTILEIVKITLPSAILAITVYFLIRKYLDASIIEKQIGHQNENNQSSKTIKLQTYERMVLFCERISIPNLIMRLKSSEMSSADLQTSMLIAIQKEYEHNMAQQIYISENLWDIIEFAKNNMLAIIADTNRGLETQEYTSNLLKAYNSQKLNAINAAISAIRKETQLTL